MKDTRSERTPLTANVLTWPSRSWPRVVSRIQSLSWVRTPLLIAALSRLYSILLILVLPTPTLSRTRLVAWDGRWYLDIARYGYHAQPIQNGPNGGHHDFAFYPLWPLVIRAVPHFTALGSLVAANLFFILAAVILYRVFHERFGPQAAWSGVALLSFSPPAYVFSMAYSEPLFLLLVGLFFTRPARAWRPLIAAAAMLTRVTGLALLVPAAVEFVREPAQRRNAVLTGLAVLLAFSAWWTFIALLTGDPLGWLHGSLAWSQSAGVRAILRALRRPTLVSIAWLCFVGLMLVGAALAFRRDRSLGSYSVAAIAMPILFGILPSMARLSTVAVAAYPELGRRFGRRGSIALVVVFAALQILFVSTVFAHGGRRPP